MRIDVTSHRACISGTATNGYACRVAAGLRASSIRKTAMGEAAPRQPYTVSRLRPFARLRASMRRPPTDFMRCLKPWRRLRTMLLG
jgi:hypothetical protein